MRRDFGFKGATKARAKAKRNLKKSWSKKKRRENRELSENDAMASKAKIIEAMRRISASYPGRFMINKDVTDVWIAMLTDLEDHLFEAAVIHLCGTRHTWPPDVASIRIQCALLSDGRLTEPTPEESWGKVIKLISGSDVHLDKIERKALADVGGLSAIRISTNIASDRKRFCDSCSAGFRDAMVRQTTLPIVKSVAIAATGAISGSKLEIKSLPDPERYAKPDETRKLSKEELMAIRAKISGILARASEYDQKCG